MTNHIAGRRRTLGLLLATTAGVLASGSGFAQDAKVLRIGYQKYGTLTLLKGRGTLEKRLSQENVAVKWTEFPAGPVLLEGLNVGSIDFGTVGEAPPIFAQAAGANLVYVANEPPAPRSEAIVVPKGSSIRTLADLKGKKIALNKGSNVHYLLLKALEKAGVPYADVQTIFLPPADARAAFERGAVDAWAIWDPFLAGVQRQSQVRILADGRNVADYQRYYLASSAFADAHPEVLAIVFEQLRKTGRWVKQYPKEAAQLLAPAWGLDVATVELANSRRSYEVRTVVAEQLNEQQRIADVFLAERLLPRKVNAKDVALWKSAKQ